MPLRRLPPLAALRAFEAAARLSSFKEAADELAVTPAAISQQVRALEADLQVGLFTRGSRSVTLTEAGRQLQQGVTDGFRRLRDAVDQVCPVSKGVLKVGCSPPVATKWLVPRLHRFTERHADVTVRVESSFELSGFGPGEPDVAIRLTGDPGSRLYAERLFNESVRPLASPELVERLDLREPADIRRAPLIHDDSLADFAGTPSWPDWFCKVGLSALEAERGAHFARYADQAIDAAANGTGVVLARRFLAAHDVAAGRLTSPFGPSLPVRLSYYTVCRCGDEEKPLVSAFLSWAREEAADMRQEAA